MPASSEPGSIRCNDSAAPGGGTSGWSFVLEATRYHDSPHAGLEALLGETAAVRSLRSSHHHSRLELIERPARDSTVAESWTDRHPGAFAILPRDRVEAMLDELLVEVDPPEIGEDRLLVVPLRGDLIRVPFVRTPAVRDLVLVAIERSVPQGTDLDGVLSQLHRVRELARRFGGVRYLIDVPLRPAEAPHHFGDQWETLVALKARYDPSRILAPNQGLFGAA